MKSNLSIEIRDIKYKQLVMVMTMILTDDENNENDDEKVIH
jgi:hypothetical protein